MKSLESFFSLLIYFYTILGAFLLPVQPVMIAAGAVVILDLVTGIWAALKEKKKITSFGFGRTVKKMFIYQMVLVFSFILDTYLIGIPLAVKASAGIIGLVEAKSFFENVYRITGIDFLSEVMNKIKGPSEGDKE